MVMGSSGRPGKAIFYRKLKPGKAVGEINLVYPTVPPFSDEPSSQLCRRRKVAISQDLCFHRAQHGHKHFRPLAADWQCQRPVHLD